MKKVKFKIQKRIWIFIALAFVLGLVLYIFVSKITQNKEITQNYFKAHIFLYIENAVGNRALSGVRVEVILGYDNPEGEIIYRAMTGAEGKTVLNIPYGEYTVKWYKNEYYGGCQNLQVREKEVFVNQYLLPYAKENSMYILAEWESEEDLDICVYLEQDWKDIGREVTMEEKWASRCDGDQGENRRELVYLKDGVTSNYTIYVRDWGETEGDHDGGIKEVAGNIEGLTVSIYAEEGLIYKKEPDEQAPLWKCAYLSNGRVEEQDEYIYTLEDYAWAQRDKNNPDSWTDGAEAEESKAAFSELPGAYQQMALYIQEGFRMYHVEGEYQAYFGSIESVASGIWVDGSYISTRDEIDREYYCCDILLVGESEWWREEMAFTYDAETDWYVFSSQYEPLLAGDSLWAEWGDSYEEDVPDNCDCQITIARDADIAVPIRYDSENGSMEKDLCMTPPRHFRDEDNGLAYQIIPRVYYYCDERLDIDIYIQYLQVKLEEGQEEMEETINEKLRRAFFYGYGRGEEDNLLDPGGEMYGYIARSYMITREDERYLSMRIYEDNSFRGANHPNEWETGITFDMRTGKVMQLEDVLGRDRTGDDYTVGELLDSGAFRKLWVWLPEDKDWIEELKEDYGDVLLSDYEPDFYLTDTGLGLITFQSRYYTCLEADYEDLGIEGF